RVDDERGRRRDSIRGKRRGHELVTPMGADGDVDAGERAHDARPRAGRDHHGRGLERPRRGGDAAHAIAVANEPADFVLLLDHHAEIPRAGGDRGRAGVRVGVAVARRVGGAEQIAGVEIGTQRARRRGVEQLDGDAEAALQRDAAPRGGQLLLRGDQDEVAVLPEVRIDAEFLGKPLVGDDAVGRQLDAEAVGVLVADATAARAVDPEHTVSRSRTITRPAPSRARWYAVLTPMMPAPTITTSAVSVMAVATIRQLRWALNDLDAACPSSARGSARDVSTVA